MPSLKAIRKRIVSAKNTQKITKAMKMMSAARLRRAQESVLAIRPYARHLSGVIADLVERIGDEVEASEAEDQEGPESEKGQAGRPGDPETQDTRTAAFDADLLLHGRQGIEKRIRVVVVTSDRGLAGGFSSNINRRTERFVVERADAEVALEVLGKKGRDYLRRKKTLKIAHEHAGPDSKTAAQQAQELARRLVTAMVRGEADAVYVVYNEFKSAASQIVRVERLLPLGPPEPGSDRQADRDEPRMMVDFVYEPDQRQVLAHLLPLQVETAILRILLESIASEFGARMSAMDNASRNAKEMISRLTLQYNRARQAAITKELMEIVGGAEALKG